MEPKQKQFASDVVDVAKALCGLEDVQDWVGLKDWVTMFTESPVSDRLGIKLGGIATIRKKWGDIAAAKDMVAFVVGMALVVSAKGVARDINVRARGQKGSRIRDAFDAVGHDKISIEDLAEKFGVNPKVLTQVSRFDPFEDRGKAKLKTIDGVRYIYRQRKDDGQ